MASKINIDPAAIKRNLDLIIVVVLTLGLLGYGWLQLGASNTERETTKADLERDTKTYNDSKNFPLPEIFGLTNSTGDYVKITTDEEHGNLGRLKQTATNYVALLQRIRQKFNPLNIPDGIVLDEKSGAIVSVTLMQGGTNSIAEPPSVQVISNKGKGAKLVASTRSHGGDNESQYYVEKIDVIEGGSGYTRGDIAIVIGGAAGGGAMMDPGMSNSGQVGDPAQMAQPPMQMGMGMGSGGVGGDASQARYGLDNNTFRNYMQKTIFGLQSRCKAQRIRLPKIDDEDKEFRFSFGKVWNEFEFEPLEREIMSYQLAEIEALCRALFAANIHELYNIKRLKVVRNPEDQMEMEDAIEYLHEAEFSLNDVMKFATGSNSDGSARLGLVPGARVMPYEITFRGFSTELSKVLEELYKSQVFFVVKNIAVIEATDVVDVFEEEQREMTIGSQGAMSRREMYGGQRGMMGMGMMYGNQGFGMFGDERKRHRPASLLLDETPLKVTLKINSLKVVAKEKDESDAISALAKKIERMDEEDETDDEASTYDDKDGDGVDEFDESLIGPDGSPIGDDNDPNVTPTKAQIEAGTPPE